jgi:general secretion pathway protein I
MRIPGERLCQRGFTLIEVVVAFAIFTLAVGALYESFGGAVRRNRQAHDRDQAVMIAQSLLSQQVATPQPWPPATSGHLPEGWVWRIEVRHYPTTANPQSPWLPVSVTVHVSREETFQKEVVLRSVELAGVTP